MSRGCNASHDLTSSLIFKKHVVLMHQRVRRFRDPALGMLSIHRPRRGLELAPFPALAGLPFSNCTGSRASTQLSVQTSALYWARPQRLGMGRKLRQPARTC